jgi:hypothetical protein
LEEGDAEKKMNKTVEETKAAFKKWAEERPGVPFVNPRFGLKSFHAGFLVSNGFSNATSETTTARSLLLAKIILFSL